MPSIGTDAGCGHLALWVSLAPIVSGAVAVGPQLLRSSPFAGPAGSTASSVGPVVARRKTRSRRSPGAPSDEGLLDAAERVFAQRGFEDTKMQDIAAEARVSLRSVYQVARGKAALYGLVHETRARDLLAQIELALPSDEDDPRRALMDVIAVVAGFLMERPDFLRIQLREGGTWSLEETGRVLLVEERHRSDRLLEKLFRRGIASGVFYAEHPGLMVASLRAQEQVHLAAWIARRGRPSKRQTIDAIQRQAERLFVQ